MALRIFAGWQFCMLSYGPHTTSWFAKHNANGPLPRYGSTLLVLLNYLDKDDPQ